MNDFIDQFFESTFALFLTYTVVIVCAIIAVILAYAITSYAYYRVLKFAGCRHPEYAFIPFYNRYVIAETACSKCTDSLTKAILGINIDNKTFAAISLVSTVMISSPSSLLKLVGSIVSILCFIVIHAGLFSIIHKTAPEKERWMGILCSFASAVPLSIFLFNNFNAISKNEDIEKMEDFSYVQ